MIKYLASRKRVRASAMAIVAAVGQIVLAALLLIAPTSAWALSSPPTITAISPSSGPTGTTVTITGANLSGVTVVAFGAAAATSFTINSATSITATAPAGSGTVHIRVTDAGLGVTSATNPADRFTYIPVPTVSAISPSAGPEAGGTSVTITGTNMLFVTGVTFGTTAATSFTINSATSITATAPAGSGTVDIRLTASGLGETSATSAADQFTYVAPPTVTSISPTAGPRVPGTPVTITGTNLSRATAVRFNANPAQRFTVNSETSITAIAPGHAAGTTDITVTTPGGTSGTSVADQYTFVEAPTVIGISPAGGPTAGGTRVTISGTYLTGVTALEVNGTPVSAFTIDSPTSITATMPPQPSGGSWIGVTTAGGTGFNRAYDDYIYADVPTVTAVSPATGLPEGGNSVVITGTGFWAAPNRGAVRFGGIAATYTIRDFSTIVATAPAGSEGTVDVTVTTFGGTSPTGAADQYSYIALPTVTSISPNAGPVAGGTTVEITGTGLSSATAVNFNGWLTHTPATSFTVNSATSITATAPAGSGTVDINVTAAGGTSINNLLRDGFTYVVAPTVTEVSPGSGPAAGGTTVTITGTDLEGATAVTFGATPATGFTIDSATSITATAPPGSGIVDVRVTTTGGTSATSEGDQFRYGAITLTPLTLPGTPAGVAYSQTLTADGGTAPYAYAVTTGALPPGLALSADGTLSGVPAQQGSFDFTITATDAAPAPGPYNGSQGYTMLVGAPSGPMARTWVSGDGNDANICSRDYPCKTFAAALAQTADRGEIDCLTPGGFGTLTIAQSVSIVCHHGTAGVVGSGTDGIVINGPAGTSVTLSGLDLEGLGDSEAPAGINGIRFLSGSSLTLRNIWLHGFRGGYGIAFQPSSAATLSIDKATISGNGSDANAASGGILVQPGANASVRVSIVNSRVEDNLQFGIVFRMKGTSNARVAATLDRLTIAGNTSVGLLSQAPTGIGSVDLVLTRSTLLGNGTGMLASGSSVARVSDTMISGNMTGIAVSGGATIASSGDNRLVDNVTDGSFTAALPRN